MPTSKMREVNAQLTFPFTVLLLVVVACACPLTNKERQSSRITDTTPSFLLQGWIQHIASNNERTYDFTQAQAASRRTVEIRDWQKIGTLPWQPKTFTADYKASEDEISLTSPTGRSEQWRIVERHANHMVLQDRTGRAVTWFNCKAPAEWPDLIHASTRGCR